MKRAVVALFLVAPLAFSAGEALAQAKMKQGTGVETKGKQTAGKSLSSSGPSTQKQPNNPHGEDSRGLYQINAK